VLAKENFQAADLSSHRPGRIFLNLFLAKSASLKKNLRSRAYGLSVEAQSIHRFRRGGTWRNAFCFQFSTVRKK